MHHGSEPAKLRRLAEDARRLADLMHQPQVKRELLEEAQKLEREAQQLSEAGSQPRLSLIGSG